MLVFQVTSQNIKLVKKPSRDIIENQINFLTANFKFSEEWQGMLKIVQFSQKRKDEEDYNENISLGDQNDVTINVPQNIKAGILKIAIFGYVAENTTGGTKLVKRVETNSYSIPILKSGVNVSKLGDSIFGDKFYLFVQEEPSKDWLIVYGLEKYSRVYIIDNKGENVIIIDNKTLFAFLDIFYLLFFHLIYIYIISQSLLYF